MNPAVDEVINFTQPLPLSGVDFHAVAVGASCQQLHLDKCSAAASTSPNEVDVLTPDGLTFKLQIQNGNGEYLQIHQDSLNDMNDLLNHLRKDQHIEICAQNHVEANKKTTALAKIHLRPVTLPSFAFKDLDTSTSVFGRSFSLPILITGMTGGLERGALINQRLAEAAEQFDIPMGVGSQRIALEKPEYAGIFNVKKYAPKVFLIGNLGIAELSKASRAERRSLMLRAVEMIQADALAIHCNVLQELVQIEGERDFAGLWEAVADVLEFAPVPVYFKEVGSGFDLKSAKKLTQLGCKTLDIGGSGGTSWSSIEGQRSHSPQTQSIGEQYRNWGIPTGINIKILAKEAAELNLIATGGVRCGEDIAKLCGLGAKACGVGLPLFLAALNTTQAVVDQLAMLKRGLEIAMYCTDSQNLNSLKSAMIEEKAFLQELELYS